MQAIVTKFFAASDKRGSRLTVKCQGGVMVVGWDHSLNVEQNHHTAAMALVERMGWASFGSLNSGAMDTDHQWCHVLVKDDATAVLETLLHNRLSGNQSTGNPYCAVEWQAAIAVVACAHNVEKGTICAEFLSNLKR